MGSLRLADCVLEVVREGVPVTARAVARRLGADTFRVDLLLRDLEEIGIVAHKTRRCRSRPRTYTIYKLRKP